MKRLIENTVFSGFVTACRLATWPTRISPSFVKATTEGVRRLPSWLGMTAGVPPSITETTELVVPRSIPITLAIASSLLRRLRQLLDRRKTSAETPLRGAQQRATDSPYITSRDTIFYWVNTWAGGSSRCFTASLGNGLRGS